MDQLDQQRERIQDDLRGLIAGDVRCDDIFLQLYASDASIYEIRPLGVVRPRSTADVVGLRPVRRREADPHPRPRRRHRHGRRVARGRGWCIDFSKYLRRVIHIDDETVRVQPGVVHERLNAHLRRRGRHLRPRPGHQQRDHHRRRDRRRRAPAATG